MMRTIYSHRIPIKNTYSETVICTERKCKGEKPKIPLCKTEPIPDNDWVGKNLRLDRPGT